jgi:hypothetical protein
MIILSCDPGKKNCAFAVVRVDYRIDLTLKEYMEETIFTVLHHSNYDLSLAGQSFEQLIESLNTILLDMTTRFAIDKVFIELQGFNHGRNTLPVHVINNSIQAAVQAFAFALGIDGAVVNPRTWKAVFHLLPGIKSLRRYQELRVLERAVVPKTICNTLIATVHEYDAIMIGISGFLTVAT